MLASSTLTTSAAAESKTIFQYLPREGHEGTIDGSMLVLKGHFPSK